MKKNTNHLKADTFYHIYNRGIDRTAIFSEDKNYHFFLDKYIQYISQVADTYAYCLLKNHFHFLIKTKTKEELLNNLDRVSLPESTNPVKVLEKVSDPGYTISKKLSNLFNSYTQAFNNMYERTGGLFETPFRRIEVTTDEYFTQLVYYIHTNPQKHGVIEDFREYPYSSYAAHLSNKQTRLKREEVLKWFGDKEEYKRCHEIGFEFMKIEMEF